MTRREKIDSLWEMDHPLARKYVELYNQGVESGDQFKFAVEWKQNHPEEAKELKEFLNEYIQSR